MRIGVSDIRDKNRVIYALLDPRDESVRYIGTAIDPTGRLKKHMREKRDAHTPKGRWLAELQRQNMEPIVCVLESNLTFIGAFAREEYWISEFLKAGVNLTNTVIPKDRSRMQPSPVGLRHLRIDLRVSQEGISCRTRTLSATTIRSAEEGKRVAYDTAIQILDAVNALLSEAGKPMVTLEDLGLRLQN